MRDSNANIFLCSSDECHHRIKCICTESLHLLCDNQTGGREKAFLSSDDGKDQSSWGARMEGAGPSPMVSCLLEPESGVERENEGAAWSFSKSLAQKQIKKLILSNFMSTTLPKDTELLREIKMSTASLCPQQHAVISSVGTQMLTVPVH